MQLRLNLLLSIVPQILGAPVLMPDSPPGTGIENDGRTIPDRQLDGLGGLGDILSITTLLGLLGGLGGLGGGLGGLKARYNENHKHKLPQAEELMDTLGFELLDSLDFTLGGDLDAARKRDIQARQLGLGDITNPVVLLSILIAAATDPTAALLGGMPAAGMGSDPFQLIASLLARDANINKRDLGDLHSLVDLLSSLSASTTDPTATLLDGVAAAGGVSVASALQNDVRDNLDEPAAEVASVIVDGTDPFAIMLSASPFAGGSNTRLDLVNILASGTPRIKALKARESFDFRAIPSDISAASIDPTAVILEGHAAAGRGFASHAVLGALASHLGGAPSGSNSIVRARNTLSIRNADLQSRQSWSNLPAIIAYILATTTDPAATLLGAAPSAGGSASPITLLNDLLSGSGVFHVRLER